MGFIESKNIFKSKLKLFSMPGTILEKKEFQTNPLVPPLLHQLQAHT